MLEVLELQIISKKSWIRRIDFVFYNEAEIRLAVLEAKFDGKPIPAISRNASKISDPTASEAIVNLTPIATVKIKGQDLQQPEKWLAVIDKTYAWTAAKDNLRYQVAKLKYKGVDYRAICFGQHISIRFLYTLLEKFRGYAASQARDEKLISQEDYEEIFL